MALRLTLHFDLANFPTRRCRCSRNHPPTPRQPGPLGPSTPPTLSQPRTISWSATGRPPSAHSYPVLRRLPRAASLARLGRQSAPAHCSGRRVRLLLRRPCWSVSVGSYRPCPTHGTAAHGQGRTGRADRVATRWQRRLPWAPSSRSAAASARSPAVSRRTCTSESRVLVRCIVRARVHAPALMERPRQTPRRWSAPGPA